MKAFKYLFFVLFLSAYPAFEAKAMNKIGFVRKLNNCLKALEVL